MKKLTGYHNRRNRDDNRETKRFKRSFENEPRPDVEGEEKEDRKPKRKVAVLMSYCGSGYKGMQLNPPHKTIEGDLFEAFVKAGAISRANSDDPKKVRIHLRIPTKVLKLIMKIIVLPRPLRSYRQRRSCCWKCHLPQAYH